MRQRLTHFLLVLGCSFGIAAPLWGLSQVRSASSCTNQRSGGFFMNWGSAANAATSDDPYAFPPNAGSGIGPFTTAFLRCDNYGFSIPSAAIIEGIQVRVERNDPFEETVDDTLQLLKAGLSSGHNKVDTSTYSPFVDGVHAYGGSNDLWNVSWAPSDINASSFGVILAAFGFDSVPRVDHIAIEAFYTLGTAPEPGLPSAGASRGLVLLLALLGGASLYARGRWRGRGS